MLLFLRKLNIENVLNSVVFRCILRQLRSSTNESFYILKDFCYVKGGTAKTASPFSCSKLTSLSFVREERLLAVNLQVLMCIKYVPHRSSRQGGTEAAVDKFVSLAHNISAVHPLKVFTRAEDRSLKNRLSWSFLLKDLMRIGELGTLETK